MSLTTPFSLNHVDKLAAATAAAIGLTLISTSAVAFPNTFPDPFVNQTVVLQTTAGTLATLPGVGPGGATLLASEFVISGFTTPMVVGNVFGAGPYRRQRPAAGLRAAAGNGDAGDPGLAGNAGPAAALR